MTHFALVIDGSESADANWPEIKRVADSLLSGPQNCHCVDLHFLGNPTPYAFKSFSENADLWRQENRRRASLISPVYDYLSATRSDAIIVVLGSGFIFDIEDWFQEPIGKRTTFVQFGEAMSHGLLKEYSHEDVHRLSQRLEARPTEIKVECLGAMPVDWNNPAYHFKQGCLVGEGGSLDVQIHFVGETKRVVATASYRIGETQVVPLRHLKDADKQKPQVAERWERLSEVEAAAARHCVLGEPFRCPICSQDHPPHQRYCEYNLPGGHGFEELRPVFKTVDDALQGGATTRASGFVLFQVQEDAVEFSLHPRRGVLLADGGVATLSGRRASIYRFSVEDGVWSPTDEDVGAYLLTGSGIYATVL